MTRALDARTYVSRRQAGMTVAVPAGTGSCHSAHMVAAVSSLEKGGEVFFLPTHLSLSIARQWPTRK